MLGNEILGIESPTVRCERDDGSPGDAEGLRDTYTHTQTRAYLWLVKYRPDVLPLTIETLLEQWRLK